MKSKIYYNEVFTALVLSPAPNTQYTQFGHTVIPLPCGAEANKTLYLKDKTLACHTSTLGKFTSIYLYRNQSDSYNTVHIHYNIL